MGAGGQHADAERGDHGQPHRRVARAHVLHQIVGAHDEQAKPRMGAGDLLGAQHPLGRLHHRPHRHVRRRARGIEQRHDVRHLRGAFDLGHQDRVGTRLGDRLDVGLAPRCAEPVAADGDLALAVGAALGRQHDVGARGFLGLGRHGVLEVEDQRIGRQGPGLLQRACVGARHIEDAAARADGL
jgi:hypothetical protein